MGVWERGLGEWRVRVVGVEGGAEVWVRVVGR